jgi:hypothetical protein
VQGVFTHLRSSISDLQCDSATALNRSGREGDDYADGHDVMAHGHSGVTDVGLRRMLGDDDAPWL